MDVKDNTDTDIESIRGHWLLLLCNDCNCPNDTLNPTVLIDGVVGSKLQNQRTATEEQEEVEVACRDSH